MTKNYQVSQQWRANKSEQMKQLWKDPQYRAQMAKRNHANTGIKNKQLWQSLPPLPEVGLTYTEFMTYVNKNAANGCWEYKQNVCGMGYACGRFDVNGEMVSSPGRAAYGWAFGNAPAGRKVVHTCGNKLCVNPDHLAIPQTATAKRVRSKQPYSIAKIEESFYANVDKRGDDECWEWTASIGNHGYGQLWCGNTVKPTHRVSYELHKGSLRKGDMVLHSCHNKKCCNPNHLRIGDQSENMKEHAARFKAKGGIPAFSKCTPEMKAKRLATRAKNFARRKELLEEQRKQNVVNN